MLGKAQFSDFRCTMYKYTPFFFECLGILRHLHCVLQYYFPYTGRGRSFASSPRSVCWSVRAYLDHRDLRAAARVSGLTRERLNVSLQQVRTHHHDNTRATFVKPRPRGEPALVALQFAANQYGAASSRRSATGFTSTWLPKWPAILANCLDIVITSDRRFGANLTYCL